MVFAREQGDPGTQRRQGRNYSMTDEEFRSQKQVRVAHDPSTGEYWVEWRVLWVFWESGEKSHDNLTDAIFAAKAVFEGMCRRAEARTSTRIV